MGTPSACRPCLAAGVSHPQARPADRCSRFVCAARRSRAAPSVSSTPSAPADTRGRPANVRVGPSSSKLSAGPLTSCLLRGQQTWARCRLAPSTATPVRATATAAEIAIASAAAAGAAAETVAAPRAGTTTASATAVVTVAAATMTAATVAATGSTMIEGPVAEVRPPRPTGPRGCMGAAWLGVGGCLGSIDAVAVTALIRKAPPTSSLLRPRLCLTPPSTNITDSAVVDSTTPTASDNHPQRARLGGNGHHHNDRGVASSVLPPRPSSALLKSSRGGQPATRSASVKHRIPIKSSTGACRPASERQTPTNPRRLRSRCGQTTPPASTEASALAPQQAA